MGQRREAGCVLLPARGQPRQLPSCLVPGPRGEPVSRQEETVDSEPRISFLSLPQTHSLEPFFLSWFSLGA